MINNQTITAIDINGKENTFYIRVKNENGLDIFVFDNQDLSGDFFEFKVILKGEIFKVQNMFAHNQKYRKQGLPEALIEYTKNYFKKPVYSSSTIHIADDWLSVEGKKVWERMVSNEKAVFDKSRNRYKSI